MFFCTLAETVKDEYFELKSIQTLIDFNYPLVQKYLIRKLFIPYCVFQFFYLLLVFYAFEQRFDGEFFYYFWSLMIVNVGFATYFFSNEFK